MGTAEQLELQDVHDQPAVNYQGPVFLTQAVLPAMREQGSPAPTLSVARALRGAARGIRGSKPTAFANAQTAQSAGAAIADAATSAAYRFRWQTSSQAQSLVGVSPADHDGDRVLNLTRPWSSWS